MRRLLTVFLLLAFILSFQVIPALAEKQVSVTRVENDQPIPIHLDKAVPPGCIVGNDNPSFFAINNFILPPEHYKLAFDPRVDGGCDALCVQPTYWGFKINAIHIYLQVSEPCTLQMSVDLEEAVYSADPDCPEPGNIACGSMFYEVILPGLGMFDVSFPVLCDCLSLNKRYLLGCYIQSYSTATGSVPALVTDAGPAAICTNWNNYGTGWYDLVVEYPTWPGNLVFNADADCCALPVPIEEKSWGMIKQLYSE